MKSALLACMRFVARFWPSMIVLGVILYGTLASHPLGDETLPPFPYIDKVIHFMMMGGLVAAILFDLRREKISGGRFRPLSAHIIIYVALGVAVFSLVDEWMQGVLVNGRPSEVADGVANILGVACASLLAPPVLRLMFPDQR